MEKARDVARALEPADLETLLLKLRSKVTSFQEDILDGRPDTRVCGILLAQALVLAALALFAAALGIRAFIGEDSHWFFDP